MVVALGQGFATGGMEVLSGSIISNGYLGIPPTSVQKTGDFVRAVGLCLFAPLGGYLMDNRYSNWTVQVTFCPTPSHGEQAPCLHGRGGGLLPACCPACHLLARVVLTYADVC